MAINYYCDVTISMCIYLVFNSVLLLAAKRLAKTLFLRIRLSEVQNKIYDHKKLCDVAIFNFELYTYNILHKKYLFE